MPNFELKSDWEPAGDQPKAIAALTQGFARGLRYKTCLGVTGSGKTFTMANVINTLQMPALIISHNKTLAGQLYQEMRDFFPNNGVSYYVSYYDYYQPEAYIPQTDTYIEKEAEVNEVIDKLRLQSTTNILTRKDVIVVASVSCIYNIGAPAEHGKFTLTLKIGDPADWKAMAARLVDLLHDRSEFEFKRGTFRLRGQYMDIYPAYDDIGYRVYEEAGSIVRIVTFDPLSGKELNVIASGDLTAAPLVIYPAKQYLTDPAVIESVEKKIRSDLALEVA